MSFATNSDMDVINNRESIVECSVNHCAGLSDVASAAAGIQLWVVDDRSDVREPVVQLLHGRDGIVCTGQFATAEEALSLLAAGEMPHVILLDVNLAENSGLDFIEPIKAIAPQVRVLMFTTFSDSLIEFMAYTKGADGFLLKAQAITRIIEAICHASSDTGDRDALFPGRKKWSQAISVPSIPATCRSKKSSFLQSLRAFLAL
jgi:DNA-binding NarL/FixJ family response regulator